MNAIQHQPPRRPHSFGIGASASGHGTSDLGGPAPPLGKRAHLTKFAFLLSSARAEGTNEPVVGMDHDVEMAACFSDRHLRRHPQQGMHMMCAPPSISSSSLSMEGRAGTQQMQQQMGGPRKAAMLAAAATNMAAPFYTTPDTVASTATTILKNVGECPVSFSWAVRSDMSGLVHIL